MRYSSQLILAWHTVVDVTPHQSQVCDGGLCQQIRHEFGGIDDDCRGSNPVDYVGYLHIHLSIRLFENAC